MSIMRGTKPLPNSLCRRSASACLRTEPNTRNPFETSTFVAPQPIPVETPVTTTSLLFAIVFLLRRIATAQHSRSLPTVGSPSRGAQTYRVRGYRLKLVGSVRWHTSAEGGHAPHLRVHTPHRD